jgi:hypothetical protein
MTEISEDIIKTIVNKVVYIPDIDRYEYIDFENIDYIDLVYKTANIMINSLTKSEYIQIINYYYENTTVALMVFDDELREKKIKKKNILYKQLTFMILVRKTIECIDKIRAYL